MGLQHHSPRLECVQAKRQRERKEGERESGVGGEEGKEGGREAGREGGREQKGKRGEGGKEWRRREKQTDLRGEGPWRV